MTKFIAFALVLSTSAVSAQTLPLSQSPTFQNGLAAKANTNNPTFTGSATFASRVNFANSNTSGFYADYGTGPFINFANSTIIQWNPNTSQYEFDVNSTSTPRVTLSAGAANFNVQVNTGSLYTNGNRIDHIRGSSAQGGAFTLNPGTLAIQVPVSGAANGDFVVCALSIAQPGGVSISSGGILSNGNVQCLLTNTTSSGVPISSSYYVYADVTKRS